MNIYGTMPFVGGNRAGRNTCQRQSSEWIVGVCVSMQFSYENQSDPFMDFLKSLKPAKSDLINTWLWVLRNVYRLETNQLVLSDNCYFVTT